MTPAYSNTIASIVTWLVLGLAAGLIIHLIDPREGRASIAATTVMGILGAVVGGFLSNLLFGIPVTGFNVTSLIIAVVGGLLLASLQRLMLRDYPTTARRQVGTLGGRSSAVDNILPKGTRVILPNGTEFETSVDSKLVEVAGRITP